MKYTQEPNHGAPYEGSEPHSKCAALRELLCSSTLEFLMEAHNGISARLVEEAGFKGIWASGLTLSAQFGVRDNNEASWTQVVDMLEFMSDATCIPILLDGDTGYGDFNNMRRLVRKLGQRGVAGVCIEDKQFPKTNSFIHAERQALADVGEFQGKIKAGKDSQIDPNFCVVARIEALIAGWGLDEALHRAEAYQEAGADAILVHSKRIQPDEILAFAREWPGHLPLIIVPTKYYSTPTDVFRAAGISTVIWANHTLRSAVASMSRVLEELQRTETLVNIEDQITPLEEIFRLQGADELLEAERYYTVTHRPSTSAVVLAASRGEGLEGITEDRPKVMVSVAGRPLLQRMVYEFRKQSIDEVTVVAGYKPESIDVQGIRMVQNTDHARSGELASLECAREALGTDCVITYGDLLFRSYILRDLLAAPGEIVAVVDSAPLSESPNQFRDLAYCSVPDDRSLFGQEVDLLKVTEHYEPELGSPSGRWIGMVRIRRQGRRWLLEAMEQLRGRADFAQLGMPHLLNHIVAAGRPIKVLYIHGHWLDVNNPEDLRRAGDFAHGRTETGRIQSDA